MSLPRITLENEKLFVIYQNKLTLDNYQIIKDRINYITSSFTSKKIYFLGDDPTIKGKRFIRNKQKDFLKKVTYKKKKNDSKNSISFRFYNK